MCGRGMFVWFAVCDGVGAWVAWCRRVVCAQGNFVAIDDVSVCRVVCKEESCGRGLLGV